MANYNGNKFPTQENDIRDAVNFVMNKTSEYVISDDVVMLGASAGAHLALLQAYKYTDSVKAKAVISFFGPTDLADMYNNPANPQIPYWMQVLLGGTPVSNGQMYKASSPINFIDEENNFFLGFRLFNHFPDFLNATAYSTQRIERHRKRMCNDVCDGGFSNAGRSPQDHRWHFTLSDSRSQNAAFTG